MKTDKCIIDSKASSDQILEEISRIEYHIIEGIDTLEPIDVAEDLYLIDNNLTYEQSLMQALIMDRLYYIVDEENNFIGQDYAYKGRNLDEFLGILYPELEYEWMKDDLDIVDDIECECIMAEEMERYDLLRTKIQEYHITDKDELTRLLQSEMDETVYRLKIHFNTGDRKFLIIVTDMVQFYWYKVLIELVSWKDIRLKYLGSDCDPEAVLYFIGYFSETGQPLHCI